MATYRLTHAAESDLLRTYVYGAQTFGIAPAEAYFRELHRLFELLAENPAIARVRPEFDPPVRIHPHRAHIVIYKDVGPDILVIRVRHHREDWAVNLFD